MFLKTIVDLEIAHMKTIQNVNATVTVRDLILNVVLEVVDMKTKPNVIPVLTVLDFHIIAVSLEVANMKRAHNVNATLTVLGFHFKNVALEAANGIRIKTQDKPENQSQLLEVVLGLEVYNVAIKFAPITLRLYIKLLLYYNIRIV